MGSCEMQNPIYCDYGICCDIKKNVLKCFPHKKTSLNDITGINAMWSVTSKKN